MKSTDQLKQEIRNSKPSGRFNAAYYKSIGYKNSKHNDNARQRADAVYTLFSEPIPHIYQNDWIVGSIRPIWIDVDPEMQKVADQFEEMYPRRHFSTNADHFAPNYRVILKEGISGLLRQIEQSKEKHQGEEDRLNFLEAMQTTLAGLQARILKYADRCRELQDQEGYDRERLQWIEENCRWVAENPPDTFARALQLVWMIHTCFSYQEKYAMSLGRMDQYLYPLFRKEIQNGSLTEAFATELLENVFIKIHERKIYLGGDDVVNICIGGSNPARECEVNEVSYLILTAVKNCKIAGPNLSARIAASTPDEFLDACLQVIRTGIGYPALMNDEVNIPALRSYGCYEEEDLCNYCMVGCIENFIPGKQPAWSDGRFDTPRFFEYLFNEGVSFDGSTKGLNTGSLSEIKTMEDFMERYERQLTKGAEEYINAYYQRNTVEHPENATEPFLSCFCDACIERGLDINMGGSKYPSAHAPALMGIGTVADSLAAVRKVVFTDHAATLEELRDALKANFKGYETLRETLLRAPKYGNNDNFVDQYAVWFVDFLSRTFKQYKSTDGGCIYVAIAANTSNISAGAVIGATPDGRLAGEPLSDAASPTYGRDTHGPTMTVNSVTKPDYTQVACGTVLNQKYSPGMFEDGKREKLRDLIRVYFEKGGQEIQINATSREVLKDAMEHPENYSDLVVRVSGFSAFYVCLDRSTQEDILHRTQQG